jgi:hypothetical protein
VITDKQKILSASRNKKNMWALSKLSGWFLFFPMVGQFKLLADAKTILSQPLWYTPRVPIKFSSFVIIVVVVLG